MMVTMDLEWIGGPWDGSTFTVPDGLTRIEITLSTAVLPNFAADADDDERGVQVPGKQVTKTLSLPVHRRMSDGAFIVRYSEITDE